jgi:predicted MFS family arabinose efflux permease
MVVFGLAIAALGFAENAWWLGIAYTVMGMTFGFSEVVTSTLWQRMVPDDLRGRVMSTMSTLGER